MKPAGSRAGPPAGDPGGIRARDQGPRVRWPMVNYDPEPPIVDSDLLFHEFPCVGWWSNAWSPDVLDFPREEWPLPDEDDRWE